MPNDIYKKVRGRKNPKVFVIQYPASHAEVHVPQARAFVEFLVSPGTQRIIADFGRARYGEPLFVADAGKAEAGAP